MRADEEDVQRGREVRRFRSGHAKMAISPGISKPRVADESKMRATAPFFRGSISDVREVAAVPKVPEAPCPWGAKESSEYWAPNKRLYSRKAAR